MDQQCNLCGTFNDVKQCEKCESLFCRACALRHGTICDAPTRVKASVGMSGATVRSRTDTEKLPPPPPAVPPHLQNQCPAVAPVSPVHYDPKLGPVREMNPRAVLGAPYDLSSEAVKANEAAAKEIYDSIFGNGLPVQPTEPVEYGQIPLSELQALVPDLVVQDSPIPDQPPSLAEKINALLKE